MSKALLTDTLLQSVGAPLIGEEGEIIGEIVEITRNAKGNCIEYIILISSAFYGDANRFFAIPASSRFIDISEENEIILQIPKQDLQFAKRVAADKCPKPNLKFGKSIFELYNYKIPAKWQSNYLREPIPAK